MSQPTKRTHKTAEYEQYLLNESFDEVFNVLMIELLGYDAGSETLNRIAVNSDGTLKTGFSLPGYDYIGVASGATTDTYTYKTGGADGSTVATITVTYTDSTKATIASVAKT